MLVPPGLSAAVDCWNAADYCVHSTRSLSILAADGSCLGLPSSVSTNSARVVVDVSGFPPAAVVPWPKNIVVAAVVLPGWPGFVHTS